MSLIRITVLVVITFFASLINNVAEAEEVEIHTIRKLTAMAEIIVVGKPIETKKGTLALKYKIETVLKGPASLKGKELPIASLGISRRSPFGSGWMFTEKNKPSYQITKALLFLQYIKNEPRKTGCVVTEGYYTVEAGVRMQTKSNGILIPTQWGNPGPVFLVPSKFLKWKPMVEQVHSDLAVMNEIRLLKAIPKKPTIKDYAKRNQAIFKWIKKNKDESSKTKYVDWLGNAVKGKPFLKEELHKCVMKSEIPADCWKSIKEITQFKRSSPYSFCSPEGRKLLVEKVFDEQVSNELRLVALRSLGWSAWPGYHSVNPSACNISKESQQAVIKRLIPLLKHKDVAWRLAAVESLSSLSYPGKGKDAHRKTKLAVPEIAKLYKIEKDREVRREARRALQRIEDDEFWSQLVGNPDGISILINYTNHGGLSRDGTTKLYLIWEGDSKAKIIDVPSFQWEKLQKDGTVEKTNLIKFTNNIPLKNQFKKGWGDKDGRVTFHIPASQLEVGHWRVRAIGKHKNKKWRSEYVIIKITEEKGRLNIR